MTQEQEQLKLWKEFEWTWEEYDVLKYYDRYDQKLLFLTKTKITNETNQSRQNCQSDTKASTA
jgi:hypothetical protein